jgi:uncharacterized spore protein YtfJ
MADRMSVEEVFSSIKGTRDSLSVRRSFGDVYDVDGVTVIPVARVAGGAGGGGGEGVDDDGGSGGGFGTGFGLGIKPLGVYEVRGDHVEWKPTVDVNRAIKGGQILAGILVVCVTLVTLARTRCRNGD